MNIRTPKCVLMVLAFYTTIEAHDFYKEAIKSVKQVSIYSGNSTHLACSVREAIEKYGVIIKEVNKLDKDSEDLHVIYDAFGIPFKYFPKNYIVFQTLDFDQVPLTKSYFEKLEKAIAVWDPSWKNIAKYSLLLDNYYYYSEFLLDPLILPCLIPIEAISSYKEVLKYANAKDSDISSHLPAIFAHTVIQNPQIVIESGVRSGESSYAFKKAIELCNSTLIGIDIDIKVAHVYEHLDIKKSELHIMDDLKFLAWWNSSLYQNKKVDIVFIDTSHFYDHTMQELELFLALLNDSGLFIFHDANICPLENSMYQRINNTCGVGWNNGDGVSRAIKDFFGIQFDVTQYASFKFYAVGSNWLLIHYPYCNGLTLIKKLGNRNES